MKAKRDDKVYLKSTLEAGIVEGKAKFGRAMVRKSGGEKIIVTLIIVYRRRVCENKENVSLYV